MKKIVFVILLLAMVAGVSYADDLNKALLDQANVAFKEAADAGDNEPEVAKAAYLKAAKIFTQIIDSGVENGDIYYNLGNCYYQANDFPMALLQYRRALLFSPQDEKIESNIASTKRMLRNEDPEEKNNSFFDTFLAFNGKIPLYAKEYFNKISYALFWGGLIGFVLLRKKIDRKKFLIIAVVWWLALASVSLLSYFATTSADGVILKNDVIARKGDGDNYSEAFFKPLTAGTEFTLLEKRGEWLHVNLTTGNKCWIKLADVGLVKVDEK